MKYFVVVLFSLCLPACTLGNLNSIFRTPDITHGSSAVVDAKQRFVLTYPGLVKYNAMGEIIPTNTISCAEPSPDAFSVYAASGELAASRGDAGGSGSFATSESGASLLERTTSLQALRDAYFRLCEGYAIGAIDEIDFMIGQRHNQTALMGLLAIEEMKAAAKNPPVVIGGAASATSASGIREVAKIIGELAADNAELESQNTRDEKSEEELETQLTAQRAIIDDETKSEAERGAATKEQDRLFDAIDDINDEVSGRRARLRENERVIASLKTSLENGGPAGATARSLIPAVVRANAVCDKNCSEQKVAIAREMVKIVQELNNNDFGPTICLSYLRRETPRNVPDVAVRQNKGQTSEGDGNARESIMAQTCQAVLDEYVAKLRDRRVTANALAEAIIQNPEKFDAEMLKFLGALIGLGMDSEGNFRSRNNDLPARV